MIMRTIVAVALLTQAGAVQGAGADVYLNAQDSPLHLGRTFSASNIYDAKADCLDFTVAPLKATGTGATNTVLQITRVKSVSELYGSLGIDMRMEAQGRFLLGRFAASFSGGLSQASSFREDAITWTLSARSEYPGTTIKDAKLTAEAQALIKAKRWNDFAVRCGTDFVKEQRNAVQIVAVYTVRNISADQQRSLTAAISEMAEYRAFSGEFAAKYSSLISTASSSGSLTLSIHVQGGPGVASLAPLITAQDDLEKINTTISDYVSKLGPAEAVPARYTTGSLATYGLDVRALKLEQAMLNRADREMTTLLDAIQRLDSLNARVREILADSTADNQSKEYYRKKLGEFKAAQLRMDAAADSCAGAFLACNTSPSACAQELPKCTSGDVELPEVTWPTKKTTVTMSWEMNKGRVYLVLPLSAGACVLKRVSGQWSAWAPPAPIARPCEEYPGAPGISNNIAQTGDFDPTPQDNQGTCTYEFECSQ